MGWCRDQKSKLFYDRLCVGHAGIYEYWVGGLSLVFVIAADVGSSEGWNEYMHN